MSDLPRLLHITADFPDRLDSKKAEAVAGLIATADWAENRVISMNRVATPWYDRSMVWDQAGVTAMAFFGLRFGIGLGLWMDLVAKRVAEHVDRSGWRPDLVHAHKLTFEGLVGQRLSRHWRIPLCVTVRGNTDHRVVSAKPVMRRRFRRVLGEAAQVFLLAPWSKRRLEQQLSTSLDKAIILPNACAPFEALEGAPADPRRFVSLFHLRNLRFKNVGRIFGAMRLLRDRGLDVCLDVIGSADDRELGLMAAMVRRHGVQDCVRALRAMTRDELRVRLPGYAALVLPSYPETFGLVYIEALGAGIPVIHARNSGIDGYFSDPRIAIAVDHRDTEQIAQAIAALMRDQEVCRRRVREFVQAGGLDRFRADNVAEVYRKALEPLLPSLRPRDSVARADSACAATRPRLRDDGRGECAAGALPGTGCAPQSAKGGR